MHLLVRVSLEIRSEKRFSASCSSCVHRCTELEVLTYSGIVHIPEQSVMSTASVRFSRVAYELKISLIANDGELLAVSTSAEGHRARSGHAWYFRAVFN